MFSRVRKGECDGSLKRGGKGAVIVIYKVTGASGSGNMTELLGLVWA